jgi:hypothetical protein
MTINTTTEETTMTTTDTIGTVFHEDADPDTDRCTVCGMPATWRVETYAAFGARDAMIAHGCLCRDCHKVAV